MFVQSNGISLFYDKTGAGDPLLLLHGNGEDHHIFDALSAKLKEHFTVYAIDSRNHGQSTKTQEYGYEAMAEDIYTFITHLGLGRVLLVGFSDGGIIALLLAIQHPEVLERMVLLGANLSPDDFTEESYSFVKSHYETTKDPLFRLMLEQPHIALEDLAQVKTPALVVMAEHDIFKPELLGRITMVLPYAKPLLMKEHKHDSYVVNTDILAPILLDFLEIV